MKLGDFRGHLPRSNTKSFEEIVDGDFPANRCHGEPANSIQIRVISEHFRLLLFYSAFTACNSFIGAKKKLIEIKFQNELNKNGCNMQHEF
jgi:hypothetical protein